MIKIIEASTYRGMLHKTCAISQNMASPEIKKVMSIIR